MIQYARLFDVNRAALSFTQEKEKQLTNTLYLVKNKSQKQFTDVDQVLH